MWECQNKTKKPVASHSEANGTCSNVRISDTLKSEHAEIRTICVCPKNPECSKSERAEIQTGLRSDFGPV